jgi:hypothetical protein
MPSSGVLKPGFVVIVLRVIVDVVDVVDGN